MNKSDNHHLRRLLERRLAYTDETQPRPLALRDLPISPAQLFGEDFRREFRPAAVLIPIIDRASGLSVLLTQRSHALRSHAGQIAFPGGSRERGDKNLLATALREANEEVSLDPRLVRVLGYLDDYPTTTRFLVTPVVGLVCAQASVRADGCEVADTLEVPFTRVLKRECYKRQTLERFGIDFPVYTLQQGEYKIWGATAGMLLNLRRKVLDCE